MKKVFWLIFTLTGFCISLNAQETKWTLEQCIDTAIEKNRNIRRQKLTISSKTIEYKQTRNNLLPTFAIEMNHEMAATQSSSKKLSNVSNNTVGYLTAGLTLFDGFRTINSIKSKAIEKQIANEDLESTRLNITANVIAQYMDVMLNKELYALALNQLRTTQAKITQRKMLVVNKRIPEGDMLELYSQEAKEKYDSVQAYNNLELSKLIIKQTLELKGEESFDLALPQNPDSDKEIIPDYTKIIDSALNNRPEIIAATLNIQHKRLSLSSGYASFMPILKLSGNFGTSYYADNTNSNYIPPGIQLSDKLHTSINVTLTVPIFDGFAAKNNIKILKLQIENSKIELENTKIEMQKAVHETCFNTTNAKNKWIAACKSVVTALEANRYIEQKFDIGKASFYELYQSKNNLTKSVTDEIISKYEYILQLKLLHLYDYN